MDCVVVRLRLGRQDRDLVGDIAELERRVVDLVRAEAKRRGTFRGRATQISRNQVSAVLYLTLPLDVAAEIDHRRGAYSRGAFVRALLLRERAPARKAEPEPLTPLERGIDILGPLWFSTPMGQPVSPGEFP